MYAGYFLVKMIVAWEQPICTSQWDKMNYRIASKYLVPIDNSFLYLFNAWSPKISNKTNDFCMALSSKKTFLNFKHKGKVSRRSDKTVICEQD